jgi:hypothetical protein
MVAVLFAQFLSALADNALLFGTLALMKQKLYPVWTEPLLQEFFVAAFIVLAPFSGPMADSWPKGRVMLLSNCLLPGEVRHSVRADHARPAGAGQRPDGILHHRCDPDRCNRGRYAR